MRINAEKIIINAHTTCTSKKIYTLLEDLSLQAVFFATDFLSQLPIVVDLTLFWM